MEHVCILDMVEKCWVIKIFSYYCAMPIPWWSGVVIQEFIVIAVHADGLAPNGARPSVGTVLTTKSDIFTSKFEWPTNDFV